MPAGFRQIEGVRRKRCAVYVLVAELWKREANCSLAHSLTHGLRPKIQFDWNPEVLNPLALPPKPWLSQQGCAAARLRALSLPLPLDEAEERVATEDEGILKSQAKDNTYGAGSQHEELRHILRASDGNSKADPLCRPGAVRVNLSTQLPRQGASPTHRSCRSCCHGSG